MKKPITDEKFYITDIPKDKEKVKQLLIFLGVYKPMLDEAFIPGFIDYSDGTLCCIKHNDLPDSYVFYYYKKEPLSYQTVITYDDLMANYLPKDTALNDAVDEALKEVSENEDKPNKVKNINATHYELWNGFEAIDIIKNILSKDEYIGYLKGNILKYQLRVGKKDNVEKEKEKIKDYQNELNEILGNINVQ